MSIVESKIIISYIATYCNIFVHICIVDTDYENRSYSETQVPSAKDEKPEEKFLKQTVSYKLFALKLYMCKF